MFRTPTRHRSPIYPIHALSTITSHPVITRARSAPLEVDLHRRNRAKCTLSPRMFLRCLLLTFFKPGISHKGYVQSSSSYSTHPLTSILVILYHPYNVPHLVAHPAPISSPIVDIFPSPRYTSLPPRKQHLSGMFNPPPLLQSFILLHLQRFTSSAKGYLEFPSRCFLLTFVSSQVYSIILLLPHSFFRIPATLCHRLYNGSHLVSDYYHFEPN